MKRRERHRLRMTEQRRQARERQLHTRHGAIKICRRFGAWYISYVSIARAAALNHRKNCASS